MKINSSYKHLVFVALIITLGLGFALALPWLANNQSLAAQSERSELVELSKSLDSEVNAPDAVTCFATFDDGTTPIYSSSDSSAVQNAVDDASPGNTVKVAGTCVGVQTRAGLSQTVYISKSLTLEGGHTTSDWTLEPDPETYTTTLDANRLGRVVLISGTVDVTLDSLFITGGFADNAPYYNGGGINSNGALTLSNSIVYSNTAQLGGGMNNDGNRSLLIEKTIFLNNKAWDNGGGLHTYIVSPTLNMVEFIGNNAEYGGGGMLASTGNLNLNGVNFVGNVAETGGGSYFQRSNSKLTNVSYINNFATENGGGVYNTQNQSVMTNTQFSGNRAEYGGAIDNIAHVSTLINTTFSGNDATADGGGMRIFKGNADVYNSVFWNNRDSSGTGTISATIFLRDTTITLSNSILEDSGGSDSWALDPTRYVNGGFNKDTDPLFVTPVDPATAPTADGDLRLAKESPAIDMGNNGFINVPIDLDGNPRIMDGDGDVTATVDMGAYEYQIPYIYDINLPLAIR